MGSLLISSPRRHLQRTSSAEYLFSEWQASELTFDDALCLTFKGQRYDVSLACAASQPGVKEGT